MDSWICSDVCVCVSPPTVLEDTPHWEQAPVEHFLQTRGCLTNGETVFPRQDGWNHQIRVLFSIGKSWFQHSVKPQCAVRSVAFPNVNRIMC